MPIIGSPGDLFVNAPDIRHGVRGANLPLNVGIDPNAIEHRIVPMAPAAFRPAAATIKLAAPIPLRTATAVTDAARRTAMRRATRGAISARSMDVQNAARRVRANVVDRVTAFRDRIGNG